MKVSCSFKRQTVKRTAKDLHAQMDTSQVVPSMYEGVYLFGRDRNFPFCFGGNDSTLDLIHNILITGLGWSLVVILFLPFLFFAFFSAVRLGIHIGEIVL